MLLVVAVVHVPSVSSNARRYEKKKEIKMQSRKGKCGKSPLEDAHVQVSLGSETSNESTVVGMTLDHDVMPYQVKVSDS